uniref:Polyunsaturated fatty acid synthase subunit A n=1 Tax=Thraustochytrium sp. (strain ATCC 26185 / S-3) TaxID=672127 RepID=PFA1_THRS2|nr:RecName: Full=Polyunsaturated fatty acid synthase subunit A; Short=PUFAs-A [Thraustochytrium sp. ATCC 26185]AOG21004.1 polyunsaturated fatty acid synthase subunit A [Thraustochytrium sp. ATCC 26185]
MAARAQNNGEMDTRIAVIGMSAILPCGTTVRESWETIRAGIDCLSDLPEDRVDVTAYFDPVKTTKDKIYCKRGGFIPEYDFDAREFGLNMFQMEDSDANQTISLLKVKEALQDAGIDALSKEKKNIGCVLGIGGGQKSSHEFYSRLNYVVVDKVLRKMGMPEEDIKVAVEKYKANFPEWRLDSFPGFLGNVTAGRCTNTFNLDGMNCVVDAACASSLIAVKVAIDELLHGDCDMMVTGATCTDNSIGMYMAFSKTPVFSTDPSVRAYDEKTKGMLIGEGSAMLVLKRYADAVRDGDDIHAVIRGCASSSDGKAAGIYTPTISGQEEALRRAYNRACVDPATVTLVEGHGTGTPVGDRIELTALRNLFDKAYGEGNHEKVAVGSIKSTIGHLKAVAGLAGMIKVIMALKHKTLPGTINVDNPPALYDGTPINESSLYINTMNRPWFPPPGVPRRAGISSFGFGGANYHAVLEEAEPEHASAYRLNKRPQPVLMLANSAQELASLCRAQLAAFEAALEEDKAVKNVAYIKCVEFCEEFKFPGSVPAGSARLGFLVKDAEDATATLRAICAQFAKDVAKEAWRLPREGVSFRAKGIATEGAVAALFSGQGAQYTHMFSEVAMNWPQFRQSISAMDAAQCKVAGEDKDFERVSQVLYPRKPYEREQEQDHKKISLTAYSQPSTLACALGAFEIFKDSGFTPDFAAGHSLGEFAALYAAGCVDRDELYELVCRRARIMGGKDAPATPKGCMAAVIGPDAEKIQIRSPNVWLGNSNSPSQTVITGSVEGIQAETAILQKEGFRVVPLACESAFHSPQMENASAAFKDVISKTSFRAPKAETKLFSNVSGETYPRDARDMLTQHMTSSVKFLTQVRNMHQAGARIFVEFGPKQVLSKLVSETLKDDPSIVTVSVNPASGKDSDIQLRDAAVQLVVAGVNLQGFDKWDAPDATRMKAIKKKRTTLRLSAATYVSDKTKKVREAAMNDGRCISYIKNGAAAPAPAPVVDEEAKREAARLQKQLEDAQRQLDEAKRAADEANQKLAAAKEEAKSAAASSKTSAVDTAVVEKHRAILKSMLAELDGYGSVDASALQQQPAAAAPAPAAAAPAPAAPAPAAAVDSALLARAESVVMEVLATKTGYETDMIEADMELETELGIDSIKRVEILSEVQAQLNVEAKDVDALSRTRTVGEVVDAMKAEIAGSAAPAPAAAAPAAAAPAPAAAAAPAAPAAGVDSALLERAETVVMEVLAAKTGYETDMIEADMELETELGIDSIKRVEILSEVQAQLNVEAKDVDALSRTRTVGEVVNAMKAEISGGSAPAPAAAAPAAAAPAPAAAPAAGVDSALLAKAETVVMEVLAAKTGYETDMIEADMELETELGIDSIKRVEILSEVQAQLNVEAKDVDALSRTRTVGEVVNAMKAEISGGSAPAPAAAAPAPAAPAPAAAAPAPAAGVDSALLAKAETVVMEVLAAKTGYETDMIEADMELETELGIDSIKRVEILSEVQAQLNVEAKDVDALSRTRTVGEVVDAMKAEISGGSAPAPAAAAPAPAAPAPAAAAPAPAAGVDSALLAKAETVVMEVLAAKTGYETDMIEADMELETELGIDSIKRVEILSEVQAQLNVEAKDVDALSRTRTVGEVVDAMKAEISGGSAPAPAAAAPAPAAAAPAPAAAAPAAGVDSALLAKAETVVMEVLAAKTGYETDMIESDMELETELGIDSIKRVEILSEVQAQLNVEAKDVDALSRTRTVGEVVDAMKAEISGGSAPAAAAPAPAAAAPAPAAAAPAAGVDSALLAKAETVVMEVLAAKTGYETDMIESDMELETELGIDSIKRVEILSEVQAQLNVEAKDVDALSRTRTVGEVVDAMKAEISGGSAPAAAAPAPAAAAPAPAAAAPAAGVDSALLAKAETVVMEVLAAKTGYETDMIEADMELETELGIDSIKRVEILSEVQAQLNVEAKDVDALSRTRTVGEVVDAMKAEISGGSASASAPAPAATAAAVKIDSVHGADCDDLSLMHAKVVDIRRPDELLLERPENRPVLVVDDGSELTLALVRVLGACAVVLTFDGLQLAQRAGAAAIRHVLAKDLSAESAEKAVQEAEQRFGKLGGLISQQADRFEPASILGFTLMLAKFAKASLCTSVPGGRPAFIGVARLDGRLGFTSQDGADALTRAQRGAIFGLCKTIGLEWSDSDVFSRGVDVAQNMHPEDAAVAIVREMACADIRVREVGIGANQQRCTIRAVKLEPGAPQRQISKDDVLVVSGGARGITPLCIREITRQISGGKYILLGRSKVSSSEPTWCAGISDDKAVQKAATQELKRAFAAGEGPKPTPRAITKLVGSVLGAREVRSSVAAIEALGGKAIYSSCDVNSAADVAKAVREAEAQLGGRVSGIVHASGVLRDRLIEKKLPDEFDAVYGTKVAGLENLLNTVDRANLKHMVLFSSLAGFHGNVGQSDYAMANEALNKIGLELSNSGVSVKSICFGPWDGGMVTPQLKKQFQEMGVQIIPREGGADTVARIVLGSSPAEILVGNWRTPTKKIGTETITLHRKISAKSNAFLDDHVIQGRRVLPMTLAIGSLAETCLGLFPGYSLWAIDDAQLFKGVTVDGDVNCEIALTPSEGQAGRVNVQATLKTFSSGKLVPAYRAVVVLSSQGAPPANATMQPPSLSADPAAQSAVYDGKTLFHGPAFRGIDEVLSCSKSQLVAKCRAVPGSDAARAEFATDTDAHDPFVNDLAFQAMLVWVRRTLGQAALPNSIQRIVQHRPVPQDKPFYITLRSNQAGGHSQHKHALQFHNEQGDLFIDVQASVIATDSLAF